MLEQLVTNMNQSVLALDHSITHCNHENNTTEKDIVNLVISYPDLPRLSVRQVEIWVPD